jgi:hypothetical protein
LLLTGAIIATLKVYYENRAEPNPDMHFFAFLEQADKNNVLTGGFLKTGQFQIVLQYQIFR